MPDVMNSTLEADTTKIIPETSFEIYLWIMKEVLVGAF